MKREVANIQAPAAPSPANPMRDMRDRYWISIDNEDSLDLDQQLPVIKRVVRVPNRWERIVALASDLGHKLPSKSDALALRTFMLNQRRAAPERFADLSLSVIKLIGRGEYVVAFPGLPSPGHFDLALHDYTHTTPPNRRYPDLIMQRLLKSCLLRKLVP